MITFNEVFYKLPKEGWLDMEEGVLLYVYAHLTSGPILEVGSYAGRSSVLLAYLGRPLYCVDNFVDGTEASFKENTKEWKNITLFQMPVEEWTPRDVGFAFLDGDHTYEGTKRQIQVALKCHPQYIAMHDIGGSDVGLEVERAAFELLGPYLMRAGKLAVWKV